MAEYRLAPAAERDLEVIWAYTVQRWSVEQAHRYIDILTAAFAALASRPGQPKPVTTFDLVIVTVGLSGT